MNEQALQYSTEVDDYLNAQPQAAKDRLAAVRALIHRLIPEITEKMGYGIPTFQLYGKNLVHIGGSARHIGFYPGPDAIVHFAGKLSGYTTSNGTVQLPHDQELPLELLEEMLLHLKGQAMERAAKSKPSGKAKT